jgi:hypothetical protein
VKYVFGITREGFIETPGIRKIEQPKMKCVLPSWLFIETPDLWQFGMMASRSIETTTRMIKV